jgi:hypothetical protein
MEAPVAGTALSEEQQQRRLAELRAGILICKRCECAATEKAEAEGVPIAIRPDVDARALLHLA